MKEISSTYSTSSCSHGFSELKSADINNSRQKEKGFEGGQVAQEAHKTSSCCRSHLAVLTPSSRSQLWERSEGRANGDILCPHVASGAGTKPIISPAAHKRPIRDDFRSPWLLIPSQKQRGQACRTPAAFRELRNKEAEQKTVLPSEPSSFKISG